MTEDTVECAICGKRLRRAGLHFIRAHDMTAAEYRAYTARDSSARRDECIYGHSLADAYIEPNGYRACRECKRINGLERSKLPEVKAQTRARSKTPAYRAAHARRERKRHARLRAERANEPPAAA